MVYVLIIKNKNGIIIFPKKKGHCNVLNSVKPCFKSVTVNGMWGWLIRERETGYAVTFYEFY